MTGAPAGWRVSYQHHIEYGIVDCADLLDPRNDALICIGKRQGGRRFVVVDENVHRIHAKRIAEYFERHDVQTRIVSFPGGEESKSVNGYLSLLTELDCFPIDRRDEPIIAIGGGVLTDMVAFVAATYRRGVPHIKVPTTLMGYVDASVGVKSGINFYGHKNRVGAFAPPLQVLLDRAFLRTLPRRHLLNGTCEIIKLAVIADAALFELLEAHGAECIEAKFQDPISALVLDRAVQGMIGQLQANLYEECLARTMDFGHTFSYGLETAPDSPWLHGEAVLMDVLISSVLASSRQLLSAADVDRIFALAAKLGIVLPGEPVDPSVLWHSVQERTLHRDGLQRIPLPRGIGECVFVNDVTATEVDAACGEALKLYGAASGE